MESTIKGSGFRLGLIQVLAVHGSADTETDA